MEKIDFDNSPSMKLDLKNEKLDQTYNQNSEIVKNMTEKISYIKVKDKNTIQIDKKSEKNDQNLGILLNNAPYKNYSHKNLVKIVQF